MTLKVFQVLKIESNIMESGASICHKVGISEYKYGIIILVTVVS